MAATAGSSSASAETLETFVLPPGISTAQQVTATTTLVPGVTKVTISGTITLSAPGSPQSSNWDPFYADGGSGKFASDRCLASFAVGAPGTPAHPPLIVGPCPAFSPTHTYTVLFNQCDRQFFWAWPVGVPPTGSNGYSGAYKVAIDPNTGAPPPAGAALVTCPKNAPAAVNATGSPAVAAAPAAPTAAPATQPGCFAAGDCAPTAGEESAIAALGVILAIGATFVGTSVGGAGVVSGVAGVAGVVGVASPSAVAGGAAVPSVPSDVPATRAPGGEFEIPEIAEIAALFGPEPPGPPNAPPPPRPPNAPPPPTPTPVRAEATAHTDRPASRSVATGGDADGGAPTVEEIVSLFGDDQPPPTTPSATTPSATTPSATTPSATTPSATTPGPTAPSATAPSVTVPTTAPATETDESSPAAGGRTPLPVDAGKAPGQETLETISTTAGTVKDTIARVKKTVDDLGISDESKKKVNDGLRAVGEKAGEVKDAADKANEYVKALDENLRETGKLGLSDDSQNFLGWWRVTFKAIGEVTEKFVDKVTAPVTSFIKRTTGVDAEDKLHQLVPIKEFGDELSKLPTSASKVVVGASNRDQIDEAGTAWHGKVPDPDDLSVIFGSKWEQTKSGR